ncbi:MAG: C25 family cysteine peptidase [bacterium]
MSKSVYFPILSVTWDGVMKLFLLTSAIFSYLLITSLSLSPESSPDSLFDAGFSSMQSIERILLFSKYALVVSSNSLNVDEALHILLLAGYKSESIRSADPSFHSVKRSVDSVISINGRPSFILIIGDENMVEPQRSRVNPYSLKSFSTDFDYGLSEKDFFTFITVARIPVRSQESLDRYIGNAKRMLFSDCSSSYSNIAPFYDASSDSVEDYLYYTLSYRSAKLLPSGKIHSGTNSIFPKYLFDLTEIDDSLWYPEYDWSVSTDDISSSSALYLSYRGHGNPISTVLPLISLSDIGGITFEGGGVFASFACLLSAFDNITSGFSSCFAESLVVSRQGGSVSVGFSTETFYQLNNTLLPAFLDHADDNVLKNISSPYGASVGDAVRNSLSYMLTLFGFNSYTECQISSCQIFGFPFISTAKEISRKPFLVPESLLTGDSVINVELLDDAPFYLSWRGIPYDSLPHTAGTYFIKTENLEPGDTLFASSYFKGRLFVDTIIISQSEAGIYNALLSDRTGDCDGLIESGEKIEFTFFSLTPSLPCTIICREGSYTEVLSALSDSSFAATFNLSKDAYSIEITVLTNGKKFIFTYPAMKYSPTLSSIKAMDSPFVFSRETLQFCLEFKNPLIFSTPCSLRILESPDYSFSPDSWMIIEDDEYALFFREMTFNSDSSDLKFEYRCNLFTDTLCYPYVCSKRNSIFIYDPMSQYINSAFVSFLRDSLKFSLKIENEIDCSLFWPANIFAFGIYPNNEKLDSSEALYIKKLASLGSSVLIDGGDALGYDKEGIKLQSLFNISSALDGQTVYAGSKISFPAFDIQLSADTTVKFVDSYTSSSPFLFVDSYIVGSISENRIAQSYPLTKLECEDYNWLCYLYASFLLDYNIVIDYPNSIDITFKKSAQIANRSAYPAALKILYSTSFFDSIVFEDSRIILPDSQKNMLFFIKRGSPSFKTEILFSTGFDTMSIAVSYSSNANPKKTEAKLTADGFSFTISEEGRLLLPPKADKTCFVKKCKDTYTIFGDIQKLEGEEITFRTSEYDILILLPKASSSCLNKEAQDVYNLLGSKTVPSKSGIYFSKDSKFFIMR